jgi:uncharacterized membrane protein
LPYYDKEEIQMSRKHIIIISTMLIIGVGFFLTTWILSQRVSVDSNDKEEVLNVTKTLNALNHSSTPKEKKDVPLKEKTQANDTQEMSKATDHSQGEEFQDEEIQGFLDSLTSQAESQNDEVSKAKEKAAKYDALEEPLPQIQNLNSQYWSIVDELTEKMNYIGKTGRGIDMGEFTRKLDERDAIARQILAIAREASKIVPDAIEVRELFRDKLPNIQTLVHYDIIISREKLKEALGEIPPGIEELFPGKGNRPIGFALPEDENFSYYEFHRRKAQNR